MAGNILFADKCLEQSIRSCVREIDSAEHPIPFLLSPIVSKLPSDEIKTRIDYNRDNNLATPVIEYEVAKPKGDGPRTLHRIWLLESVEYDLIARYFASISCRLTNKYSHSFVPDQMWDENTRRGRNRWMKFRDELSRAVRWSGLVCQCDIEDYFNFIPHEKLTDAVHFRFTEANPMLSSDIMDCVTRLHRLLSSWFPMTDCRIPQGSIASFFFADVLLLAVDKFWEQSEYSMLRFVDDFFLLEATEGRIVYQLDRLEVLLEQLGLNLNSSKTKLSTSEEFVAEIHRLNHTKDRFSKQCRVLLGSKKIPFVLQHMTFELQRDIPNKSWLNYLLQALKSETSRFQDVLSDNILDDMMATFHLYQNVFGNAVSAWRFLFNALIERPEIQEFIGQILASPIALIDTDKAFCYGSFGLTDTIQSKNLRLKMVSMFEDSAVEGKYALNGSEASCCGKALLAAMKHGKGAMILHELVQYNTFAEMRLYSAVAASYLPTSQRKVFCRQHSNLSQRLEEILAFDYFEEFDEEVSPERVVRPATQKY